MNELPYQVQLSLPGKAAPCFCLGTLPTKAIVEFDFALERVLACTLVIPVYKTERKDCVCIFFFSIWKYTSIDCTVSVAVVAIVLSTSKTLQTIQ